MQHLKGLNALESLRLSNAKITDASLGHLKGLTNLENLILTNTQITAAGFEELQAALPECNVLRSD